MLWRYMGSFLSHVWTASMSIRGLASLKAISISMLPVVMQVKQEVQQEEEEEVICIKEEPEEEQEVMATLLLDCQVQQSHLSESEVRLDLNIKSENAQTKSTLEF